MAEYEALSAEGDRLVSDEWPPVTIRGLMLGTAVLAAALALARQFWLFGGVALFIAAGLATYWSLHHRKGDIAQRMLLDLVWGVGMPLVCLVLDPFLFQQHDFALSPFNTPRGWTLNPSSMAVYASLGYQIALMLIWLLWGKGLTRAASFFSGSFFVGAVIAGGMAVMLAPFALMGVLAMGIGLLGFTPWLTMRTFWRRAKQASAIGLSQLHEDFSAAHDRQTWGATVAVVLPVVVYFVTELAVARR